MSEFSGPVRIDTIGTAPREIAIEADADERAALARRFGIETLEALSAMASVTRQGEEIRACGRLSARIVQLCVASNVPLPAAIDAPFDIAFRTGPPDSAPEIELSEEECDVVFYEGGAIDLGEAVAETLALAIDPYPRAPGADAVLKEMGVLGEGQTGPFAALAGLKI